MLSQHYTASLTKKKKKVLFFLPRGSKVGPEIQHNSRHEEVLWFTQGNIHHDGREHVLQVIPVHHICKQTISFAKEKKLRNRDKTEFCPAPLSDPNHDLHIRNTYKNACNT